MAIAFATAGTSLNGTTSLNLALPASIAVGDLLVIALSGKYPASPPATPTAGGPWQAQPMFSGGAGASGADSGQAIAAAFTKIVDQAFLDLALTTIPITITGGNAWRGKISRYTKGAGVQWGLSAVGGPQNTAGTAWSVVMPSDPDIKSGDYIIAISAVNSDVATFITPNPTLTVPGATVGTRVVRDGGGSTGGDDHFMTVIEFAITAGQSTGAATYAMTGNSTAGNAPAGATLLLRLRETTLLSGGLDTTGIATQAFAGQSNTPGSLSTAGSSTVALSGTASTPGSFSIVGQSTFSMQDGTSDSSGALAVATTGGMLIDGSVDTPGALDIAAFASVQLVGEAGLNGQLVIECHSVFEESPDKGFLTISARAGMEFSESDYRPLKGAAGLNGAILGAKTGIYTVLRTPRGTFNDEGEYVPQVSGQFTTDMAVQPGGAGVRGGGRSGGKFLTVAPEGQSSEDERLVFTTEELWPRTPTHDPDIVIIKNEPYKVDRVKEWEAYGSLHYEAYVCRITIP
jgi:hypothetical protein